MKTGIELIKKERKEQIEIHKWDIQNNKYYGEGQLVQAALFCYQQAGIKLGMINQETVKWPNNWMKFYEDKIRKKSVIQQLVVGGAFYLAEFDRTNNKAFECKAIKIASEIDVIIYLK